MKEHKKFFLNGMKAGIPVFIGFIPISMTFAISAIQAGLSINETNTMSICLLAGASQMMAVNMLSMDAGLVEIVIAAFVLNLRHFIMSTYVMNRLKNTKIWVRCILAFGVTDETFAIFAMKEKYEEDSYFFAGLAGITYFAWVIGTVFASLIAAYIPLVLSNSLGIALYAMFIALLIPDIKGNMSIGIMVIIGILLNYILGKLIPFGWAIVVATILSAFIGTFIVDGKEEED